ncbi:MAG TPA: GNAT family N-acetyltransferase [Vicinamibacterales bacterium]|nr:GNAT family N-acetyltransferase [Vicinamibacterales bacterium]
MPTYKPDDPGERPLDETPIPPVRDNRDASRFELEVDGQIALLRYQRTATTLALVHTEVPEPLRGRHLGDALAKAGIDAAQAEGLTLVIHCPFVRAYLRKHPEGQHTWLEPVRRP